MGQPKALKEPVTHVVIPDCQVKPGVPTIQLSWIGQYIVDQWGSRPNVKIIQLGDFADMASLSSYDKGKKSMEGRRYVADIEATNEAWARLNQPLTDYNAHKRALKERQWTPERHLLLGNHEQRILRATDLDPQMSGILSLDHLDYERSGWRVHHFLEPIDLDGIFYSHYWANPLSGRVYGGLVSTVLKNLGHSFTMGHRQVLEYAVRFVRDRSQHGLVAGAAYLHPEIYLTPQGNSHWRGIIVCHQCEKGSYDPMFVSLDFLSRKYENLRLADFMQKYYPNIQEQMWDLY